MDMTPADVMALNHNEDNGIFSGGCGGFFWIVVLFLVFGMMGNGGLWGGNNAALQGTLTRAELSDGLNSAEMQRNQIDAIRDNLNNRYDMAMLANANQKETLENRYATQLGFNSQQAQMAACCCEIKTAVHAEGEATRNMMLQQQLDQYRQDLQAAQLQLGNAAQTQTLLSAINPTPRPAYVVQSPYVGYTTTGGCFGA